MRLLVGLGNPGPRYFGTRHNLGFELIDRFGSRHGLMVNRARHHGQYGEGEVAGARVALFKPKTFMDLSGFAVQPLVGELPEFDVTSDLLLVYDELDLPCGQLRVRGQGGPGGHNGVASVIDALGTKQFARLRFGIGRPPDGGSITDHVLSRFSEDERDLVDRRIEDALELMDVFVEQGVEAAMSRAAELPEAESRAPSDG